MCGTRGGLPGRTWTSTHVATYSTPHAAVRTVHGGARAGGSACAARGTVEQTKHPVSVYCRAIAYIERHSVREREALDVGVGQLLALVVRAVHGQL